MTNQEKQRKLVETLGDYIARYVEENSPVTFAFRPCCLTIEVCGTKNLAMLKVARDAAKDKSLQLRLQLGVVRKGLIGSIPTLCPLPTPRRLFGY